MTAGIVEERRNKAFFMSIVPVVRFLLRTLITFPVTSGLAWRIAPHIRRVFCAEYEVVTTFDRGLKLNANLSDHIESQIFWQGTQEGDRGEMVLLGKILAPDSVFVDIGANVGVFSLFAARRLTAGHVHAFEPYDPHLARFRGNITLNQIGNITVNPFALSNSFGSGDLYIPNSNNTGMASLYSSSSQAAYLAKCEVETTTLDQYVCEHNIERVDVMKIDVEGAELDVVEGSADVIKKFRPEVVMEVNIDHLSKAGRTIIEMMEFWRSSEYIIFTIKNDGNIVRINRTEDFIQHQNIYCCPAETLERKQWI